ncbi:hypothetical protein [Methylorubrum zatmanii]
MVWKSALKTVALPIALQIFSPANAFAEAPLDWYVDLKRDAKYAAIASSGGASASELLPYSQSVERLLKRLPLWDGPGSTPAAAQACLSAAEQLRTALSLPTPAARRSAITDGEAGRDACLMAIQKH